MAFLCTAIVGCCGWLMFYEPTPPIVVGVAQPVVLGEAALQRFAGEYEFAGEVWTIAARDGSLFASNKVSLELELLTVSNNTLALPGGGQLTVVEDRKGRVTGMIFRLDGRERMVRRLR